MTKPEDMNTINRNGKAYNHDRGPLIVAGLFCIACVLVLFLKGCQ